jgi:hypothetical protein
MTKTPALEPHWLDDVEDKDYPAAESFLGLLYPPEPVMELIQALRSAELTKFKAKDIFRASGLSLLGVSNSHVERDRRKIADGLALSPLLLVRDKRASKLIIADGYHRMCAVYSLNEDAWIPAKIA